MANSEDKEELESILLEIDHLEAKVAQSSSFHWDPQPVAANIAKSLDNTPKTFSETSFSLESDTSDDLLSETYQIIKSNDLPENQRPNSLNHSHDLNNVIEREPLETLKEELSESDPETESETEDKEPQTKGGKSSKGARRKMDIEPEADYGQSLGATHRRLEKSPDYDISQKSDKSCELSLPDYDASMHGSTAISSPSPSSSPATKNKSGIKFLGTSKQTTPFKSESVKTTDIEMVEMKTYPTNTPPERMKDLSKLPELTLENIGTCLEKRYKEHLIYTSCGEILLSVNPCTELKIYEQEQYEQYNHEGTPDEPHLFMISAKAYGNIINVAQDQVILVSGESGAGKTEATKRMVKHLMAMEGGKQDELQNKIIKINSLLEAFGNAGTVLNTNSSRFAKFLRLAYDDKGKIRSATIKDYMLEKSRVVHQESRETNFHSFYALLVGADRKSLDIVTGHKFRITGNFSPHTIGEDDRRKYLDTYNSQKEVFTMLGMESEEIRDVETILAAILHIGDIEFEDAEHDSVIIQNEEIAHKVAKLLDLEPQQLISALIQRRGRIGVDHKTIIEIAALSSETGYGDQEKLMASGRHRKGTKQTTNGKDNKEDDDYIDFSKNKNQAENERDALAKALYERMFGWLVRKINDSLKSEFLRGTRNIGILDICGFEDLGENSFEQLCINVVNEQLQNFMNKKVIEDEKQLYLDESVEFSDVDTGNINNDSILQMFRQDRRGILDSIDEDSKHEVSADDSKMVRKLDSNFRDHPHYIPTITNRPEFTIHHFAGKVKYDATGFIKKNRDTLGDLLVTCMKDSGNPLIHDLFDVKKSFTGSISMSRYDFQASRKGGLTKFRPNPFSNISDTINKSRKQIFQERFPGIRPQIQSVDLSKRQTHIHYFKNSLGELLNVMQRAYPFFVRCIKPNDDLKPGLFTTKRVLEQLKYNGVQEIARIRSFGLPCRLTKTDFQHRYGAIAEDRNGKGAGDCQEIFNAAEVNASDFKVGNYHVFMTSKVQNLLDFAAAAARERQEEERRRKEEEEKERKAAEERRRKREKERAARELVAQLRQQEEDKARAKKEEEEREERERRSRKEVERRQKEEEERRKKERALGKTQIFGSDDGQSGEEDNPQRLLSSKGKHGGPTVTFMDITPTDTPSSASMASTIYNTPQGNSSSTPTNHDNISQENSMSDTTATTYVRMGNAEEKEEDKEEEEAGGAKAAWNCFQEVTEEEERLDIGDMTSLRVVKAIVYILLFLFLLVAVVIQKVSFVSLVKSLKKSEVPGLQTVAYFMLTIVMCIPHGLTIIFSTAKFFFGIYKRPSPFTWIWTIMMEVLHSFGLCLLVFRVLSSLDSVKIVLLLNATAFLPSLLKLALSETEDKIESNPREALPVKVLFLFLDFLAMVVQVATVFCIIWWDYVETGNDVWEIIELAGALILSSFNHWENFTDGRFFTCCTKPESWFRNSVMKMRFELQEGRHYVNTVAAILKIAATITTAIMLRGDDGLNYEKAFDNLSYCGDTLASVSAIIACTISAFMAYFVAMAACKFQMQRFSFAIPLTLATPVTIGLFALDCQYHFLNEVTVACQGHRRIGPSGSERLFDCPEVTMNSWHQYFVFGTLWWLSLLLVLGRHIWRRQNDNTATLERLFINANYCGILTTEHIVLNRRRNRRKVTTKHILDERGEVLTVLYAFESLAKTEEEENQDIHRENADDPSTEHVTPMLFACATMWHETRTEMVQLLKSIHRLDMNQYIRRIANEENGGYDPKFYNFEAHILFDDAMELDDDNKRVPNRWVKDLVASMSEACSSVHGKPMSVHDPIKVPTPYGGQLIWKMPGENLLFVHLKDMSRIRNRKRWSQVMYMYYLLGYRLQMTCKGEAMKKMLEINRRRGLHGLNIDDLNMVLGDEHKAKSENTFILALDGDTDFKPNAVRILIDRMVDENVGAACGRIHPIGKGPMIMYQKFEYAVGHWLQKAAEHVFGCVLCSPGCFSLFRAKALMDANVMKRYTKEPSEPGHHLQFDQGEDRWLCTLLLQRGYKIEYAAAADAWTFAPEGFYEFFNQRRRWMPSTIANILDLLTNSARTRQVNRNISMLYILYQWFLMLMTILGPGTILMMIAGAAQLVFKIGLINAYLFAIIPAGVFTFTCFWFKQRIQLAMAAVMSVVYAFIMMIVLVGTIITATDENLFHPSVVVIVLLMFIFILTGICHPQEIGCLLHAFLYLMVIPSGYLLLVIYSIINLNDVSWGTREVPTKAQRLEMEKKKKEEEERRAARQNQGFLSKLFGRGEEHIREVTNLIKTALPKTQTKDPSSYGDLIPILRRIEENTRPLHERESRDDDPAVVSQPQTNLEASTPGSTQSEEGSAQSGSQAADGQSAPPQQPTLQPELGRSRKLKKNDKDWQDPSWAKDEGVGKGPILVGNETEMEFWRNFVNEYLLPIYPTKEEKKKTADGLRDLRNNAAFGLIIVNSLWIGLNFMFQFTEAATISIDYTFGGAKYKFEESILGLSFVIVLLMLLVLQMIGMLIHRMGTLQHLLAATTLRRREREINLQNNSSQIEDTMRKIQAVLRLPTYNDEGLVTEPPKFVAPNEANNLETMGMTVVPGRSRTAIMDNDLGTSFHRFGALLEASRRPQELLDQRNSQYLENVSRRLMGGQIRDRIGSSYRPPLPARPSVRESHNPFNNPRMWGITAKEIHKINPNMPIRPSIARPHQREMEGLGPMGRSLACRSRIIREQEMEQEVQGNEFLNRNHFALTDGNNIGRGDRFRSTQRL